MKGDFSRFRFDRNKSYTSVLSQQGRVQLDSDANEQRAIDEYLRATGLIDVIGWTGAPKHDPGFEITVPDATRIMIGAGRIYVDGLLCEAVAQAEYMQQRWLIDPVPDSAALLSDLRLRRTGALRVWLEAWQRLITPIDDTGIKDVALGEADTTARLQTVWRVVVEPAPAASPPSSCCAEMHKLRGFVTHGRMTAGTDDAGGRSSCLPSPHAAYRGLENQLYRVEVHHGAAIGQATFKWSRDNGSVLTRITDINGREVTVDSLGPDANLGFAPLQWVELSDDSYEFGPEPNRPGELLQIRFVDPEHRRITLFQPAPAMNTASGHAKLRRWDQAGNDATSNGVPMNPIGRNSLENGIYVQFSNAQPFRSGNYWLIPARTATGMPEWPPSDSDGADYQQARSITVHRAPLACIHFDAEQKRFIVDDCRDRFSPLTELTPPEIPQALHVTAISWVNDDILSLDQLLFNGLKVTLDAPPIGQIDAASFIVVLEVPIVVQSEFADVSSIVAGNRGTIRYTLILDGAVSVSGNAILFSIPRNVFAFLFQLANGLTSLAEQGEFIRARIILKGRPTRGSATGSTLFLDGQCFTSPAVRQDGTTTRTDLILPSGNEEKASDFESWFYVSPLVQIDTMTVTPSAVAFVLAPGVVRPTAKLVDATTPPINPSQPAVVPVLALTLNYHALADTTVALSVSGGNPGIVQVPTTVAIPRGANAPTGPIQITVHNPGAGAAQTYAITATLTLPSGQQEHKNATVTVTGVDVPGAIIRPGPIIAPLLGGAPTRRRKNR